MCPISDASLTSDITIDIRAHPWSPFTRGRVILHSVSTRFDSGAAHEPRFDSCAASAFLSLARARSLSLSRSLCLSLSRSLSLALSQQRGPAAVDAAREGGTESACVRERESLRERMCVRVSECVCENASLLLVCGCRANREHLTWLAPENGPSQGQNLALTVLCVPCSLDSGECLSAEGGGSLRRGCPTSQAPSTPTSQAPLPLLSRPRMCHYPVTRQSVRVSVKVKKRESV